MKSWIKQFASEDWIIVFVGAAVLALACIFPGAMPSLPKTLTTSADLINAVYGSFQPVRKLEAVVQYQSVDDSEEY